MLPNSISGSQSCLLLAVHGTSQQLFKNVLIEHFTYQYFQRALCWPRSFSKEQRSIHSISNELLSRTLGADAMKFYIKESSITTTDGLEIGKGLFSSVVIVPQSTIAYFEGRIVSDAELRAYPNGGVPNCYYTIKLSSDKYLDCYAFYLKKLCLASYANSPQGCVVKGTNEKAKSNAKLVVHGDRAKLVATRTIYVDEEILWFYGHGLRFPNQV